MILYMTADLTKPTWQSGGCCRGDVDPAVVLTQRPTGIVQTGMAGLA